MKVLMFGWEFPPHISGGLGTACYGLTKALSTCSDVDVLFVVPKAFGDEDQSVGSIIGANNVYVRKEIIDIKGFTKKFNLIQIDSKLIPYVDPEDYYRIINKYNHSNQQISSTDIEGHFEFYVIDGIALLKSEY